MLWRSCGKRALSVERYGKAATAPKALSLDLNAGAVRTRGQKTLFDRHFMTALGVQ